MRQVEARVGLPVRGRVGGAGDRPRGPWSAARAGRRRSSRDAATWQAPGSTTRRNTSESSQRLARAARAPGAARRRPPRPGSVTDGAAAAAPGVSARSPACSQRRLRLAQRRPGDRPVRSASSRSGGSSAAARVDARAGSPSPAVRRTPRTRGGRGPAGARLLGLSSMWGWTSGSMAVTPTCASTGTGISVRPRRQWSRQCRPLTRWAMDSRRDPALASDANLRPKPLSEGACTWQDRPRSTDRRRARSPSSATSRT